MDLHPMDKTAIASIQTLFETLGRDGFRLLGVAWRMGGPDHPHAIVS